MQQKLAIAFTDLHLLTLPIVSEGICNDRRVVLIYDVVLGIAGGDNDRAMYGDSRTDERGYENVLVLDQGSVDMTECSVCHSLTFGIGFVQQNVRCFIGIAIRKVACDLMLSLWILGWNKFWSGRLLLLDATRYGFPSSSAGVRGWWCGQCNCGSSNVGGSNFF